MKTRVFILLSVIFSFYSCSDESINDPQINYVQETIDRVEINSLTNFVKILSGELPFTYNNNEIKIETRNWALPGNDIAADFIELTLTSYGFTVTNQFFNEQGRNVYAVKRGTQHPQQFYIIGAHYDDYSNLFYQPDSSQIAPGADDNASGAAAVLEAARIFSEYNPRFSVLFALWDEEEVGLLGSRYFADSARSNNVIINGYINLDMIGWDSNNDSAIDVIVSNVTQIPELGLKTEYVNNAYNIGLVIEFIFRNYGSDYVSFWQYDYPAIAINEDRSDFNIYYHSDLDIYPNLNVNYFYRVSKLAIGTLAELAFNEELP